MQRRRSCGCTTPHGGHTLATPSGQSPSGLTADEAIVCIRTAIAVKADVVKEVKGDDEKGKCHALYADVQTNQVVKAK